MSKYAVIDLEMCKIQKGKRKLMGLSNEIIQIGCVLLDDNYETVSSFMTYVHPEYGHVTPMIENLTGITDEMLENAPTAEDALIELLLWLPDDVKMVSWSDSDKNQLIRETEKKRLNLPELTEYYDSWIDSQELFADKMLTDRRYNLTEALNISVIDYVDGAHDGLVDAKNTALLFKKLMLEPDFRKKAYLSTEYESALYVRPFEALLANLKVA